MEKLLFITVGVGKDADIAHGIETLIKTENPEKVILLCTRDSREKVADPFLIGLDSVNRCAPEMFTLTDENDARRVYQECKAIFEGFLLRFPRKDHAYVADFTTGTKAMSVGFALAAVAREFERLSYVSGQRGEAGRVISGTEQPRSFHPFDMYLDRDLRRTAEMFNRHQFQAAMEIVFPLQSGYREPAFQKKINFLTTLMRAFQEWDRFHLKEAAERFAEVSRDADSDDYLFTLGLKKKVKLAGQMVKRELDDPFSEVRAADLYRNAVRRMEEGKHDDAVARFYRLVEFLAQRTLKINHNIDTADVDAAGLPEEIRALLPPQARGKTAIPLERAYQILDKLGEPLGGLVTANDKMKRLQFKRNHSILAHGFNPVSKEECEEFRDLLRSYLGNTMKDFEYLQEICAFPTLDAANLEKFLTFHP